VTLIAKKLEGHKLQLAVKDTGIGISKSDQAHIFEKFWRSEDYRTRETGGTGLGLYVVRKLAKKLGIDIEMSSRLNHGSTFKFTIATSKKTR
jgi:signal transduction histidine kinase